MKSIFLTILIFIGVFALAGSDVLSVISSDWFHYMSYVLFATVMLCGVYVTMFRKQKKNEESSSAETLKIEKKEGEYDEK
ncbi:MAG: hypothetical protein IJ532_05200 [Alphaproteobacteria bacterium]|nr:hypothetical protein [Alphaproteobacteria bacterium]